MKYLFDIGHPAHVHYFRNCMRILESHGHEIVITARDKEMTLYLLEHYGFQYTCTGKNLSSKIGKIYSIIRNDFTLYAVTKKYKPDILISFFLPFTSHIGKICHKPVIGFTDTENAFINIKIALPFTEIILTPDCYNGNALKSKQLSFKGYMELCYLHPNRFAPDDSILNLLGVRKNEKYAILRFVSWHASHDIGHQGLHLNMKRLAVREFSKHAKVFISSESELPDDLLPYKINIPPELMHSALFYSSLFYGESATMASECAVLGTPAIYLDNVGRGYTEEEEQKYGLVSNFTESTRDQELSIKKGLNLLNNPKIKDELKEKRRKMLSEKIDVTAFMVWLIENYPESKKIMRENPDFQNRFLVTTEKISPDK